MLRDRCARAARMRGIRNHEDAKARRRTRRRTLQRIPSWLSSCLRVFVVWFTLGDEIERIRPQRQLLPHPPEHFLALLLLAMGIVLLIAMWVALIVVVRVLIARRL